LGVAVGHREQARADRSGGIFFTNIIFGQLVFSQFTSMKVLVRSNRRCWSTVSEAATSQAMGDV
jgi:hypothetical protein